ncbi:hypothetical protein RB598_006975 [Gaeumannomyces tritici]
MAEYAYYAIKRADKAIDRTTPKTTKVLLQPAVFHSCPCLGSVLSANSFRVPTRLPPSAWACQPTLDGRYSPWAPHFPNRAPSHHAMADTRPASSAASSVTATEAGVDSESLRRKEMMLSNWELVTDPAGVNSLVLNHTYQGRGTEESPFIVDFLPDDPHNAKNYPRWKKWCFTMLQAFACLAVAFASSAYSGGVVDLIREFHVTPEVTILGISLFVVGFAVGPLLWAPLSEFYGRQILFFFTYFALTAFNCGAVAAPSMTGLIVLRFFAGVFGSSPLTNSGGVLADMFEADERGLATAIFAAAPFLGPSIGPIAGGFLAQAAGWRWVAGLMAAFTGILWIAVSLWVPETYAPVLLRKRADKLTKLTGKVYVSRMDSLQPKQTMMARFKVSLSRPWVLLFREPIVLLTTIYMAVVYGTMYMMFPAFPIVFQQGRGWSVGVGGLAFIGITVGMSFSVVYAIFDNRRYARLVKECDGDVPPEARLPPAIIGSALLPIGLFWFAWTNGPEVHFIVPIIGSGVFAAGLVLVFLSLLNYLIDSYVVFAASVLAANSVLRSLFGAAFPLFTSQMYKSLGIHWASSVPAFLALACLPFPFLFWKYGASIRTKCKYAAEAAEVLRRMRASNEIVNEDEAVEEADELERRWTLERRQTRRQSEARRNSHATEGSHAQMQVMELDEKGKMVKEQS